MIKYTKRGNMKKYTTYLNNKGQITIPSKMRDHLGINAGSKVEFFSSSGHLIIIPLNKSIKDLKGILLKPNKTLSLDEMNEIIRGNNG